MWKTGHSLIKAKMRDTGATLAGEMSGHVFFNERWYGFDDALYTGARLLEILSRQPNAADVLNGLPNSIATPELTIACAKEGDQHALIERLKKTASFPDAEQLITIDGLRAEFKDGFGLARASNTTPTVVLRFEADNEDALTRIKDEFMRQIEAVCQE
jgi:phosphomannomutase/phosphoglucomutase